MGEEVEQQTHALSLVLSFQVRNFDFLIAVFDIDAVLRYNFLIIANFFLAITFTASTEEEFKSLRKLVQSYRWNLRVHSHFFPELVHSALRRLDNLNPDGVDHMEAIWRRHSYVPNAPTASTEIISAFRDVTRPSTPTELDFRSIFGLPVGSEFFNGTQLYDGQQYGQFAFDVGTSFSNSTTSDPFLTDLLVNNTQNNVLEEFMLSSGY